MQNWYLKIKTNKETKTTPKQTKTKNKPNKNLTKTPNQPVVFMTDVSSNFGQSRHVVVK